MEFYKTNTDKTLDKQLLTVFTDITCTEIKNNVTNEQIQALPDYFVRIAEAVRDNTYEQMGKRISAFAAMNHTVILLNGRIN